MVYSQAAAAATCCELVQEDGDGWTPLHFAALAGWHEGIELLLEHHKAQVKREQRAGQGVADKPDKTTTEEVRHTLVEASMHRRGGLLC